MPKLLRDSSGIKKRKLFLMVCVAFFFSSCATIPPSTVIIPSAVVPPSVPTTKLPALSVSQPHPADLHPDVIHVIAPGETLGMLSKMYDVPVNTIVSGNHLKEGALLLPGRSLVIPRAAPLRSVVTIFPNRKWKYIIIHHSATIRGDSLAFNGAHLQRGFSGGVGYDFVIDNGTLSKVDGEIEMTPRWIKQQDGSHCKASHMNKKAIGICLVGNFDEGKVSEPQMTSLVYLLNTLRHYYKIPVRKIMGHGQVRGADTDCPGKKFPWQEFKRRLTSVS